MKDKNEILKLMTDTAVRMGEGGISLKETCEVVEKIAVSYCRGTVKEGNRVNPFRKGISPFEEAGYFFFEEQLRRV